MFCLFYEASTKKVHSLNGSGRSASKASLEQIRQDLKIPDGRDGSIPIHSAHSVTVPGAAAGWVDCVEKFGSGKLKIGDVLKPAIELADGGYPISQISAFYVREILQETLSKNNY
jgi:gamma-glutamyltranspeptidase/glutathione hydrolase